MQERREVRRQAGLKWLPEASIMLLVVSIASAVLFYSDHSILGTSATSITVATNGATRWVDDRQVTASVFDFSPPATQKMSVSPLFEDYYNTHNGTTGLGAPLTVAFPINQGWIQFFESDALLFPTVQQDPGNNAPLAVLDEAGVKDRSTGIIRLPLLQALLTAGSKAPLGEGGSLTYVDLRKATNPTFMLPAPVTAHIAAASPAENQDIFIKGGTRAGKDVGHLIPQAFWNYINRPDISPDGWKTDLGPPLTEALQFTITKDGYVHHMLVQVFWREGLVLDQTTLDTSGQPRIQPLETGAAYLSTIGPPAIVIGPRQTIWTQGETMLLDAPGTGHTVAKFGQDFPLTPLGDTTWNSGMLWYHIRWEAPKLTAVAWVSATAVTFSSPGNVPGWASVDALSPSLAAYLFSAGNNVAAVVYDVTRQRYYTYNADTQFITGSSMKVPIMLALLDMTEREGRKPDANEMNLLTTMIENSDNDSASALYYGEIGGAAGVAHYLQRIGITGLSPDPNAWGYSLITPMAMVNLLTLMYEGKVLTAQDDNLALSLMRQIESDQQVGVGDTAPIGASVAMKDGWLPDPDGQWAMNSSGIVTLGRESYIIAVYTREQNSLGDGKAIVRHVCGTVASLLMP